MLFGHVYLCLVAVGEVFVGIHTGHILSVGHVVLEERVQGDALEEGMCVEHLVALSRARTPFVELQALSPAGQVVVVRLAGLVEDSL